jgi:general secretion pathway protein G
MKTYVLNGYDRCHASGRRCRTRTVIRNRTSAFTLIELLLVLVILSTLAAIVTPKFAKHSKKAKVTAARTQVSNFELALDAFEIEVGRYPTTAEGLLVLIERPATDQEGTWDGPYLKTADVPLDPWGGEYVYRYPGEHNQEGYDLCSYGPDQKLGGDDDVANWDDATKR